MIAHPAPRPSSSTMIRSLCRTAFVTNSLTSKTARSVANFG
jgi:hypothetical protein